MRNLPAALLTLVLAVPASAQSLEQAWRNAAAVARAAAGAELGARALAVTAQTDWSKWFYDGLYDAQGKKVDPAGLNGKIVGIYFSAHWCPPCQLFTPKLVAFRDKNAAQFEVVFVSADHDAAAQKDYMTETAMKWPAVPYASLSGAALEKKYGVQSIPRLVIVAPSGALITKEGRADVQSDPDGALAGWKKAAGLN